MLHWNDDKTFYQKLLEADYIEEYDESNVNDEDNLYLREIVDVHVSDKVDSLYFNSYNGIVKGIMYYQLEPKYSLYKYDLIPNGNWMDRHLIKRSLVKSLL